MSEALKPATSRRILIALGIFLVVACAVAATARDPGLTWDEAIYFGRAAGYLRWFGQFSTDAFSPKAIVTTFGSTDHPPLGSLWISANFATFGRFMDMISAARMGAAILFGLAAAMIFGWVSARRYRADRCRRRG